MSAPPEVAAALHAWIHTESDITMPKELADQMFASGPMPPAHQEELNWLKSAASSQEESSLSDASTCQRMLSILSSAITEQRAALKVVEQITRQPMLSTHMAQKLQAFSNEMERRCLQPSAIRAQLQQLEWVRFALLVRNIPVARDGLHLTGMHHINDYCERATDAQIEALVAHLPEAEFKSFCVESASGKAVSRLLSAFFANTAKEVTRATALPPTTDTKAIVDFAQVQKARVDAGIKVVREALADVRPCLAGTAPFADESNRERMQAMHDFLHNFHTTQLEPQSRNLSRLQEAAASAHVATMPADELAE